MQAGKGAVSSVMQAAANVAASAKSGLDKTKAVLEEKVEKMSASDPVEKDMATLRKEEKIDLAEIRKKEAYEQNAAAASTGAATQGYTDGGDIPIGSQFQTTIVTTTTHVKPSTDFVPEDVVGSHYPTGTTIGVVGSEYPPETNYGTGGQTHVVNPNPVSSVGSYNPTQTQTQTRIHTVNPDNTAVAFGSQNSSETNTGTGRSPVGDSGTDFGAGGTQLGGERGW